VIPARLQPILDDVRPLAERFAASGHALYLVGGIVRDLSSGGCGRGPTSTSRPTPIP
jgi:tRNA nucleotidyltransferase/poly(A) polymerase